MRRKGLLPLVLSTVLVAGLPFFGRGEVQEARAHDPVARNSIDQEISTINKINDYRAAFEAKVKECDTAYSRIKTDVEGTYIGKPKADAAPELQRVEYKKHKEILEITGKYCNALKVYRDKLEEGGRDSDASKAQMEIINTINDPNYRKSRSFVERYRHKDAHPVTDLAERETKDKSVVLAEGAYTVMSNGTEGGPLMKIMPDGMYGGEGVLMFPTEKLREVGLKKKASLWFRVKDTPRWRTNDEFVAYAAGKPNIRLGSILGKGGGPHEMSLDFSKVNRASLLGDYLSVIFKLEDGDGDGVINGAGVWARKEWKREDWGNSKLLELEATKPWGGEDEIRPAIIIKDR